MPADLARALRREACADRPAPSPALQQRIRTAIEAEPLRLAAPPGGRLPSVSRIAARACAGLVVAALMLTLIREPPTSAPDGAASSALAPSAPADLETAPPMEDLLADVRTEVAGMTAALIGVPEWNGDLDLDAALAFLTPGPTDQP